MQQWLKQQIASKLQYYKIELNKINTALPLQLSTPKKVAVVGGGIAGIAAAASLAERGFQVTLYEKAAYLGGKVGSWTFESKGETLRTEHGFHAFFRQYFNLRNYLKKIDCDRHLIPISDYLIMYKDHSRQSFNKIDNTPLLNVWSMRNAGVFSLKQVIWNPFSMQLMAMFGYNAATTFDSWDNKPLSTYMRQSGVPHKMKLVFGAFARAFFSSAEQMSTAELIKSFHFYFLSNDLGLLYDVLNDDFETTFLQPSQRYIESHGGNIRLNEGVDSIQKNDHGFTINNSEYDYCILAADVKHVPRILANSPTLQAYPTFARQAGHVKASARYAVYRVWTDKFEQEDLPYFVFTESLKVLDSITFYHKMEKESTAWSTANKGGIFELHSYALPDDVTSDEDIKNRLLEELYYYLPELKGMKITHEYLQHKDNFSAFHTGLYKERPTVITEVPGLYLAGDWVKLNNPSMLMEAAYTSGAQAANFIMSENGLQEQQLYSVPLKGLMG